jgi:tetratricopeptide (TPR) repeat protein
MQLSASNYLFLMKKEFTIIVVLFMIIHIGCATPQSISNNSNNESTNSNPRALSSLPRAANSVSTDNSPYEEIITVNYLNESSNIQIKLDPSKEQFYLDLRGMRPVDKDSIIVIDSSLVQNRARDIKSLLANFRKAQDLFYIGDYKKSLEFVDKTLEIQETADAYALKGTIFFMLENITAARANWNRAVQMDPNIPIPSIPELETLIQEIRGGQ